MKEYIDLNISVFLLLLFYIRPLLLPFSVHPSYICPKEKSFRTY